MSVDLVKVTSEQEIVLNEPLDTNVPSDSLQTGLRELKKKVY